MTRKFRQLAVFAAVGTASLAAQAVTQAEVDEARNECRQHKLMVQDKGSFARDEDKRAWENACGLASKKMDELAGKEPTAVATATPPAEQAQGEAAAFEAPAATNSAYHYFLEENQKRQAGGGMTAAAQDLQPAAPAAAPPAPAPEAAPAAEPAAEAQPTAAPAAAETAAMETSSAPSSGAGQGAGPDEAVLAPSAPPEGPPQEDGTEEEAPYTPPSP